MNFEMKNLIYLILGLFIFSCTPEKKQITNDKELLSDSLFAFKNIKSTILPPDSTINLIDLDSTQKMKFIVSAVTKERKGDIDADYVIHFMTASFVSKQNKIGDFTPIIAKVNGDDYSGLFYIILDKSFNPISSLLVSGGLCAGPNEISDSSLQMCPVINSFFKDNTVSSYILTETINPPKIKTELAIFDSLSYISTITSTGQIETRLIDSLRFRRQSSFK
jgi:hypothetical protein